MDAEGFLRVLFANLRPGEQINVRALHARAGKASYNEFAGSVEEALALLATRDPLSEEVYVGVNPRANRDGSKDGVTCVSLLHSDADHKWFGGDPEATLDAVLGWDLEPTLIVSSGNGLHVYWLLAESLGRDEIDRAEQAMRRLYFALNGHTGLDNVHDVSRILRVPGTCNNKDPRRPHLPVRVVHFNAAARYTIEEIEAVLPALPRPLTYNEVSEIVQDDERPSLELLGTLLAHIDPCLPQSEYYLIWAAVAYYYPGEEGLRLVDEWSSEARERNGQSCSPRTDPGKHARFRRQVGRVTTLGTLIHHAKLGGYVPPVRVPAVIKTPRTGQAVMATVRRHREDLLRSKLETIPNPGYDDLPWLFQRFYDYLGDLTRPFPRDYTTTALLSFASLFWPKVRMENLSLCTWVMLVADQGSGKNQITDAIYDVVKRMNTIKPKHYTSGTPEGMFRELKGQGQTLLCYLGEYGDWLVSLSREHMRHARGVLNNLYDNRAVSHQLAREGVTIEDPFCVIVGTTTPKMAVATLKPEDLQGGFASRFACFAGDFIAFGRNNGPTRADALELAKLIDTHLADVGEVYKARWDRPEGEIPQAYLDFEREFGIGTGEVRTFADALDDPRMPKGRDAARVKKWATIFALAERRPWIENGVVVISDRHLALALALVRRTMVYQDILVTNVASTDEEKAMNGIQRVLDRAGAEGLSRPQIMQQAHVKAADMRALIPMLQEAGLVREVWADDRILRYATTEV